MAENLTFRGCQNEMRGVLRTRNGSPSDTRLFLGYRGGEGTRPVEGTRKGVSPQAPIKVQTFPWLLPSRAN
jgi:hypothetical protein